MTLVAPMAAADVAVEFRDLHGMAEFTEAEALQRAARLAQSQARAAFEAPTPDARSSDLTVGVVNQSAVRQRLGANFGLSVHPQRPVRPAPTPRPAGRP